MTLIEAYETLEVTESVTDELIKANYKWLVWFYHPDTKLGNNVTELNRVIIAYNLIKEYRDEFCQ